MFEISDDGRVRERSEASREGSPCYTPRRVGESQPGATEFSIAVLDAEGDDAPPPEVIPRLNLANTWNIPDAVGVGVNDFSLYKFFFLGPSGNLVSVVFCSVVATAAVAELIPGKIPTDVAAYVSLTPVNYYSGFYLLLDGHRSRKSYLLAGLHRFLYGKPGIQFLVLNVRLERCATHEGILTRQGHITIQCIQEQPERCMRKSQKPYTGMRLCSTSYERRF